MTFGEVQADIVRRARTLSGAADDDIISQYLNRDLGLEGWDFIDLCEDIEKAYGVDLRPFFEEGQPEVGWWIWKRREARDATVGDLASEVFRLTARK